MNRPFCRRFFANGAPRFARGVVVGLGANDRGRAVIGDNSANGAAVILGRSAITWSGMLGKRFALGRGQSLDLQLNVENIFGQEARRPAAATAPVGWGATSRRAYGTMGRCGRRLGSDWWRPDRTVAPESVRRAAARLREKATRGWRWYWRKKVRQIGVDAGVIQ